MIGNQRKRQTYHATALRRGWPVATALVSLAAVAGAAGIVNAPAASGATETIGRYTLTEIARKNDYANAIFHGFDGAPVVAGDGTVIFAGWRRVAGVTRRGIFAGDGTSVTTILDVTSGLDKFQQPSVNEAGDVAFRARDGDGNYGIFKIAGGTVTRIADNSGTFYNVFKPDVNSGGEVAFLATLDKFGNNEAIYKGDGNSPLTLIADESSGQFNAFLSSEPSINDSGDVAFFGRQAVGGDGIFVGDGGTIMPLYDELGSLGQVTTPVVNNDGTVIFVGSLSGVPGIFSGDGGPVTTIADRNDGFFTFFGGPAYSINNNGDVAFLTDKGVFTGPDLVADDVLGGARELFGYSIRGYALGRGLNDSGDVAMLIRLKIPGISSLQDFIVLAEPVPEPSTLVLAAVGLLGVLGYTRRRRRAM